MEGNYPTFDRASAPVVRNQATSSTLAEKLSVTASTLEEQTRRLGYAVDRILGRPSSDDSKVTEASPLPVTLDRLLNVAENLAKLVDQLNEVA